MSDKTVKQLTTEITSPHPDDWFLLQRDSDGETAKVRASNAFSGGWIPIGADLTISSGYNQSNKSYEISSDTDLTSILSPGMRFKVDRGTVAPDQCTDLDSASSQYASKSSPSGITFTDDFSMEAWVYLETYETEAIILSRWNGTSGFIFQIHTGRVRIYGDQGANADDIYSYQVIPLNTWVHVAATMDCSGNSHTIYINGVSVPIQTATSTATAIVQAGNLEIGSRNGGTMPYNGKISEVRLWDDIRTATEIKDNMNQQLTGLEANLVGYWKLDGDFNDSTANANHMTGQNSAVATNSDNPFHDTEYGIITKVTASVVTVFTGADYNIPNMTLTDPYYSTQKSPSNFPLNTEQWSINILSFDVDSQLTTGSWVNGGSIRTSIPIGAWDIYARVTADVSRSTVAIRFSSAISESTSSVSSGYEESGTTSVIGAGGVSTTRVASTLYMYIPKSYTSQTTIYLIESGVFTNGASSVLVGYDGSLTYPFPHYIKAKCAYL